MKKFLHYLVSNIVNQPDDVQIEEVVEKASPTSETSEDQQHLILKLKTASDDMGIVIGKHGQTISALRTMLRLKNQATHEYLSVAIQLEEAEK